MASKSKGGWRTLAAGGAAGAIDCCFTMPLDTLGTQMQLQGYKTPMEGIRAIMGAKGVAGLYAGFWPFLIQSSAKSSIRFYGFEAIANGVDSVGIDRSKMPGFWSLFCGLGAGAVEALSLTAPTDRVKVLGQAMSAQAGEPITARELIAQKGFGTLYQGALATTMRQGSSVAVRFFCFDKIKAGMSKSLGYDDIRDAPSWVSFLAGGTGGAVSVCLNNPIDVAKSKIQAGLYTSMVPVWRDVLKDEGMIGLTTGLSARVPRLFVSQAIQFSLVDIFKSMLQKY